MDLVAKLLLHNGASDAIVRDKDKLWYLSSEELLNQDITNLMKYRVPSKGVEIAFKDWNRRIVVNNSIKMNNLEKLIKFIKDMEQSAYEMSQESIDYLKSLFQMNSHCKLRVSDHKEVEVFWSIGDSKRKKLRRRDVIQTFKHLVEMGTSTSQVLIQVVAVSASLLLVALSLYDLHEVYVDCGIIEEMIEKDKKEYVKHLTVMERILTQILIALENQSEETFNSHLPILVDSTTRFIEKINESYNGIRGDIDELSGEESTHRIVGAASALSSIASIGATIWNWDKLNKSQRTAGLLLGGATAITAVSSHLSANRVQKTREALEQVLTDLRTLNEQLIPISFAARRYYGENIEYTYLHNQFDVYRKSIEEFKAIFTRQSRNLLISC